MKSMPTAPITPDRSWHLQQLRDLKDRLLHSRSLQAAAIREAGESHPADLGDEATEGSGQEMTLSILLSEEDALYEVEAAMRRIADGSYGICEETGAAIPEDRLRALPWTRFTREAAERLERRVVKVPDAPKEAGEKADRCNCSSSGSGSCGKQLCAAS